MTEYIINSLQIRTHIKPKIIQKTKYYSKTKYINLLNTNNKSKTSTSIPAKWAMI